MDIRRGIIRAFNSMTYLADVQIVGSIATLLTGVPVAKQIGADLLTPGTKCGVLFFDETNPSDGCVVFVYDGAPGYPGARVYHSVNQSIPNGVLTALAFNSERFDTDNIHDTVTNNSRLTCKTAGKYLIIANVFFDLNTSGYRELHIRLNGTTTIGRLDIAGANNNRSLVVSTIYDLSVDDYVQACVLQSSGGPLNVLTAGNYSPEFMMVRVG